MSLRRGSAWQVQRIHPMSVLSVSSDDFQLYGPFNSYSRAVYAELIPPGQETSFFSLFALTDKSASFVGPAVVGLISDTTGNIRNGFLFLLVMLAVPLPILLRVKVKEGGEEAIVWSAGKQPHV